MVKKFLIKFRSSFYKFFYKCLFPISITPTKIIYVFSRNFICFRSTYVTN